jgi:hypothetical protein
MEGSQHSLGISDLEIGDTVKRLCTPDVGNGQAWLARDLKTPGRQGGTRPAGRTGLLLQRFLMIGDAEE